MNCIKNIDMVVFEYKKMNDSVVECQIMSFSKKNKIIIVIFILDIIMTIVNVLLFCLESENKNVKNSGRKFYDKKKKSDFNKKKLA